MGILRRKKKKEEEEELEDEEEEKPKKKKPSKPREPKKKKPPKPWGRKERIWVLFLFVTTVILSGVLALSSREWKIPGLPRLKPADLTWENFNLKYFTSEKYVIDGNEIELIDTSIPEEVESSINELLRGASGIYGVYVIDLASGVSYGINEEESFEPASLNKLPVMYAAYSEDENGYFDLDDSYRLKDGEVLSVSPVADEERTVYKYRELLELMGKRSDNMAYRIVRDELGQETVNRYLVELGLFDTSYENNETTPKDIGKFFYKLEKGDGLKRASKDAILTSLTDTIYEDYLPKGVSNELVVSHKYGREIHVINDAGIVRTEKPYIIVILSKGIVEKEADEIIPEISRIVFESRG